VTDTKSPITLYIAPLVIPVTGPMICNGAVAVRDGHILHVGTEEWMTSKLHEELGGGLPGCEVLRWDGLITPGLVNAHTHLQYTGMAPVGKNHYDSFRAWELAFNAIYDDPAPKPWRTWAHEGARQLVESGTTAAADIVSDVEAADALRSQGLHGITYWEVMDWNNEDWMRSGTDTLLANIKHLRDCGITELGISPHAPYSLGSGPLLDLPDIARRLGMRLHIHLGETPAEAGAVPSRLTSLTSWAWNHKEWKSFNDLKRAGTGASAIQFPRPARRPRPGRAHRPWRACVARGSQDSAPEGRLGGALSALEPHHLHHGRCTHRPLLRGGQPPVRGHRLFVQQPEPRRSR